MNTYTTFILDRSGSMASAIDTTIATYNEQVQQAKINSSSQEIKCSLLTFNGDVFEHLWLVPASELQETDRKGYVTEGGTALMDAVGYACKKLKETTDVNDENNAYLIIVISDGDENASRHYKTEELREILGDLQKSKRWTITYMGCTDAYLNTLSKQLNVSATNMKSFNSATRGAARQDLASNIKAAGAYYQKRAMAGNDSVAMAALSENFYDASAMCVSTGEVEALAAKEKSVNEATYSCFLNSTKVAWESK